MRATIERVIRILLADDEAMIRAGVRAILASDPELEVVAEAGDGREAVDLAISHHPDVALLDIRMPGLDGLGAAAASSARALDVGAGGFLLKAGDPRELIAGVHAVAGGAAYLSPKVAHRVITQLAGGRMARGAHARDRVTALTEREREVLALLGAGLSNAEIARRLHIVEGTVKAYVSAILGRLGVRNRVQAAIIAYEAGLVA